MLIKNSYMFSAAISVLVAVAGQANAASCPAGTTATAVKGKIFNNAVPSDPTLGTGITLGTVHLEVGNGTKVKCGIIGYGGPGFDGSINFMHTLVCDDSLLITNPAIGDEVVHSQITLNSTGTGAFQPCNPGAPQAAGFHGTFRETSIPISGRGMFQGVTAGRIVIDGTVNCQAAIDMKFQGEICMPNR